MSKGISNTSRTLKYLKDLGIICDITERWIKNPKHPAGGFRRDCFGFIDILALAAHGKTGIIGVQSCGQNFAEHNRKILKNPLALEWLKKGGGVSCIMLISWRKILKNRKGKLRAWTPRIKEYRIEDFWIQEGVD